MQGMSVQLLRRAISNERADKLADAYLDCAVLLGIYPDDTLAQKSLARVLKSLQVKAERLLKDEQLDAAAQGYRELLRCTPYDPAALVNYGRVLMRLKQPALALPIWQRLVERFPERREGHIQLARSFDRTSQFGRATKAWREVLALDPENAEAQQAMSVISRRAITAGRAAITEGQFVDAWRIFNDLRAEEPDNEEAPRRLDQIERNILKDMRAAYKQRRLQHIFAYGKRIPNLLSDNAEAQLLLARAAMELHRFDVAAEHWRLLAALDPLNSAKPHLQVARCYLRAGLQMEAGDAIKELKIHDPQNPEGKKLKDDLRQLMLASEPERR
jgi:predicted Zn-dependent protease